MFAHAETKRVAITHEDLQNLALSRWGAGRIWTQEIGVAELDRFVETLRAGIAAEIKSHRGGPDRGAQRWFPMGQAF
jgi:hypothetical protein